jgi:hypothetical protein
MYIRFATEEGVGRIREAILTEVFLIGAMWLGTNVVHAYISTPYVHRAWVYMDEDVTQMDKLSFLNSHITFEYVNTLGLKKRLTARLADIRRMPPTAAALSNVRVNLGKDKTKRFYMDMAALAKEQPWFYKRIDAFVQWTAK